MTLLLVFEIVLGVLVAAVAAFFTYWYHFSRSHHWVDKPIPYEPPIPIVGSLILVVKKQSFHEYDKELYKKHGKVFGSYTGPMASIYVAEPEYLRNIFVKDFHIFSSKSSIKTGVPLIDNMLNMLPGDEQWRNIRNTLSPAFASGRLKKMLPLLSECANLSVQNFDKYDGLEEGVDMKRLYGSFSLDVIASVAFGTRLDSYNNSDDLFVYHAKRVFGTEFSWKLVIPMLLPRLGRLLGIEFFPQETLDFFKQTTLEIVARREKSKEVRHDILQILMDSLKEGELTADDAPEEERTTGHHYEQVEDNIQSVDQIKRKPLTVDEFLAQTIIFFVAAYETASCALTVLTYHLATNPDCQKKLHEEVDRIWKNREAIDAESLFEAKYLSACVDEALRISPPAPRLDRMASQDYPLGNTGVTITKGMMVHIPVFAMHHDPEFFPEPEKYLPERFLNPDEIKPYTYYPFGAGPRSCIAMRLALMELKSCMLHVMRHFEFSPCATTKIPLEYLNTGFMQPKDVHLKVIRRRPS